MRSTKNKTAVIRLRGVRQNNLKNFDLDLPLNRLIVITGLSGSGKSSLAFDTLYAEGQRRYIETFSPYARQFFDRMDKPQVDSIEGIPPAIAIEQRNSVKSTRSTVGTMTEICDHMKLLWPHVARLHCRQCGFPVRKDSPRQVWESVRQRFSGGGSNQTGTGTRDWPEPGAEGRVSNAAMALHEALPNADLNGDAAAGEILITFDLPISEKLTLEDSIGLISRQGYQRLLLGGEILRLEEALPRLRELKPSLLTIIQDRLKLTPGGRARFIEACEQAYHFGKGKLAIHDLAQLFSRPDGSGRLLFSNRFHCAQCDIEYREPSPALFSFNHPLGACPACRGFGRIITIDYNLALPDHSLTLAQGVVKPWQSGQSAECQEDLMKFCRIRKAPVDVPYARLPKKWQDWVINGDPDYGKDAAHRWPRAWYGVKGYFRWLESKAYKMHVRVLLSRYRSYVACPDCRGRRFQPESLLYKIGSPGSELTLSDFYQLPIRDAGALIHSLAESHRAAGAGANDPISLIFAEVRSRLGYLNDAGLGYLTLDRPTRSLSGGETERVNLTTCLGTRLVNTLFVLDEPSVGLHPRDTGRLIRILEQLRDAGNTVVVVEHEASVMRAADEIIDIGPGHGATGGEIVYQGPYSRILKSRRSLTGQYLAANKSIANPARRPVQPAGAAGGAAAGWLTLDHATRYNLRDVSVQIPLNRLVCLTGVSGSGKSTLAREILFPLLDSRLNNRPVADSDDDENEDSESAGESSPQVESPVLHGWEALGNVVLVDQGILAKTPRSNPAVYIGAFDSIRDLFAQSDLARQRGLGPGAFSFNSTEGQCERCRGAGFEKIEMQFLSDVYIRCPECNGRRYRPHILEIKLDPPGPERSSKPWSIADLLDATVDEAIEFLVAFGAREPARRAAATLELLQQAGLGYLRLGQPVNALSGGECQRLKLVRHLADFAQSSSGSQRPTLFLFDEPTTGLHFDDVRVLLKVFQRLVDAGHSVLIIEHNLDVIKCADWIIDLGPEAGDQGGKVVACGTPEQIAAASQCHTGEALREIV